MANKFVIGWQQVLQKAWSVRLSVIAGLCATAQTVVEYIASGQPPLVVMLIGFTSFASAIARIVAQPGMVNNDVAK